MSFKPIRTFLTARLLETDPAFEVFDAAFAADQVGDNRFDKRFHIFYGPVTATVANQNTTQDVVSATCTLYFRGLRDSNESLDEAMDIANRFRIACMRRTNYSNQVHIKNVVATSIEAQQMPENDQQFKVILGFSISMIYGLGVDLNC